MDDIKPNKAKFTQRIGKTARPGDDNDSTDLKNAIYLNRDTVNEIIFKSNEGDKKSIKSRIEDYQASLAPYGVNIEILDNLKPFMNKVGEDAIDLLNNIYYGRRQKTSSVILSATVVGAAIGAVIGFILIPGVGPLISAPLGAALGAFAGLASVTIGSYFFKSAAETLTEKWFPGEYKYELKKQTTKNFKRKYGIPGHVLQLINGYLHNRMDNIKDEKMKNTLAAFIKVGIEAEDQKMFSGVLLYLGEELNAVQKLYSEKHKAYHSNPPDSKSAEKQEELNNLREDFKLLKYALTTISEAKVHDESTVFLSDALKKKLELSIPKIKNSPDDMAVIKKLSAKLSKKPEPHHDVDLNIDHAKKLAPVLVSETAPAPALAPTVNVATMVLPQLSSEQCEAINNKIKKLCKENKLPEITFSQKQNKEQIESSFSMQVDDEMSEPDIDLAAKIMLDEIAVLIKDLSSEQKSGYELDIEADASLSEDKRIQFAARLSQGAKDLGLKPNFISYTEGQMQRIEQKRKEIQTPVVSVGLGLGKQ